MSQSTTARRVLLSLALAFACLAVSPSVVRAQTTALFIDSLPGDPTGAGVRATYTAAQATFSVFSTGSVSISASAPDISWTLTFRGTGSRLTPGDYENAYGSFSAPMNRLAVSGFSFCSDSTGRFVVLEADYATDGSLVRFAADFEQHCNELAPGLFGALRYNSSVSNLNPFGGDYPHHRLTISPPAHGNVSGGLIDCGLGGVSCGVDFGVNLQVTLTATPEAGYVFLGWDGACIGTTTATVRVNGPRTCGAVFDTVAPSAPRTVLILDGEPGSIGGGIHERLPGAASVWRVEASATGIYIAVTRPDGKQRSIRLAAPPGETLGVGVYESATDPQRFGRPFSSVSAGSSFCSTQSGRFVVHEFVLDSGGRVQSFSADFEQHCNDLAPALFGAIRYQASTLEVEPFAGDVPRYELSLAASAHGQVSGPGLACGAGSSQCSLVLAVPGLVRLSAVPDAGYVFAGWTGTCAGPATVSVQVNGPTVCGASFEPIVPSVPRLLFLMDSEAGDTVGDGVPLGYSSANAIISSSYVTAGNSVWMMLEGSDGSRWTLRFGARPGQLLVPGSYADARGSSFTIFPLLDVNCSTGTGRFVVHEIEFSATGSLVRFAVDFEQHCGDAVPALFGILRYNSSAPGVQAFGGAYPDYRLMVSPGVGRVTGGGIDCTSAGGVCERVYPGTAVVMLTAMVPANHIFTGWAGSCTGGEVTTVHVNGPKSCGATFEPPVPSSPRSLLLVDSQPGDYIGRGRRAIYSDANSSWTLNIARPDYIDISLRASDDTRWHLQFAGPAAAPTLVPGLYAEARRAPFRGIAPGIDISSTGSGCNVIQGRFLIHEIAFTPGGALARFSADFEQHCEGQDPALFGSIRVNTTFGAVQPFGGVYPSYRLTVARPVGGNVTGAALSCGSQGASCEVATQVPATVTLEGRPDKGFVFAGWTGACGGAGPTASVRIYGQRECAAVFLPVATSVPATVATVAVTDGLNREFSYVYQSSNSTWDVRTDVSTQDVQANIEGIDRVRWRFTFAAASSKLLERGFYVVDGSVAGSARMESSGDYYCSSTIRGRFVVHDIAIAAGTVQRFAADFDMRCGNGSAPAFKGIIRYNSRITPRQLSWGTHLLVEGAGAGGGPHVQGIDATGHIDGQYSFFAYDQRFTGGVAVAYGDVDGDGAADVVTAAGPGGGPNVRVITSAPAAAAQPMALRELANFFAYDQGFYGGLNVAVGDVTGDSIAEIVIAAGPGGGPHVRVFQLQPGNTPTAPLKVVEHTGFFAYSIGFTGGVRVAVGDVDGDGVGEIITAPGAGGGPDVRAYRVTGPGQITPVVAFFAYDPAFTGGVFVASGDINGDGQDDIITGADSGGGPNVRVITTTAGGGLAEITNFFAYDPAFTGGVRVGAGDLDGDGRAEIIAGAGPGGGPHVMAVRRADDGTLSVVASFFAYAPAFTGGVFVGGARR